MFAFIILLRILFAACMVFVIGYIFGGFSKRPVLARITKVAAILAIVLFVGTNLMLNRFWFHRNDGGWRCHEKEWRDRRFEEQRQPAPPAVPPAAAQPAAP